MTTTASRRKGPDRAKVARRLIPAPGAAHAPVTGAAAVGTLVRDTGVSQQEFARLVRASAPSVSRWVRGTVRPAGRMAEKLGRLRAVVAKLAMAIERRDIRRFLGLPHPELRGHRPADLLDTDHGLDEVLALIESALSGGFA